MCESELDKTMPKTNTCELRPYGRHRCFCDQDGCNTEKWWSKVKIKPSKNDDVEGNAVCQAVNVYFFSVVLTYFLLLRSCNNLSLLY